MKTLIEYIDTIESMINRPTQYYRFNLNDYLEREYTRSLVEVLSSLMKG